MARVERPPRRGDCVSHMPRGPALESPKDDPVIYGAAVLELFTGRHSVYAYDHRVLTPEGLGGLLDGRVERLVNLVESVSAQGRIRDLGGGLFAHDDALHRNSSWDFI